MNPRLKSHVLYVDVPDGLYFECGANNFLLKGKGVRAGVSSLLRRLDGSLDLATLRASTQERVLPLLDELVRQLDRQQMLSWELAPPPSDDDTAESPAFAKAVGWLRDETPAWRAVFADWCTRPVLVSGGGTALVGLVSSLLESGVTRIAYLVDSADGAAPACLASLAEDHATRARTVSVRAVSLDEAGSLDAYGAVLHAGIPPEPSAETWKAFTALPDDRLVIGLVRTADAVVVVGPGPHFSWADIARRDVDGDGAMPCTAATQATLGAVVAFEALKLRIGRVHLPSAAVPQFIRLMPDGRMSSRRFPRFGDGPIVTPSDLQQNRFPSTTLNELGDPMTGVFTWDASRFDRFPLAHRSARLLRGDGRTVTGWGVSEETAADRAALAACETVLNAWYPATAREGPIVVRRSLSAWRKAASCRALIAHSSFAEMPERELDVRTVAGDGQMFLRLYRTYFGTLPALHVRGDAAHGAVVVSVRHGERGYSGVGSSPEEAVIEVIGAVLSAFQADVPPGDVLITPPSRPADRPASRPVVSEERMMPWGLQDGGLVAGRVVLA